MNAGLILTAISGLCWTVVYIESIRLGFQQKTYAMPFWALALNIAWELLHSVTDFRLTGASLQVVFNIAWFLLDVLILYTYFRFGKKHFPRSLPAVFFYLWSALGLATAFALQLVFVFEFGVSKGGAYAAFLQNLLMSILFIAMLVQRGGSEGQNLTIAVAKWLGTLAPTILFGLLGAQAFPPNLLVLVTGVFCSVFDLVYIGMLARAQSAGRALAGE